ncbi:Undecaprenyl-diphosphatase [uncultured archaeon]|nr:Undecaprenyl-diphosphatase [uncultured archaeon]
MISILEAFILSIVQWITELFPVSSSGHLAIFHNLLGFQNLPFDVFLHLACLVAVIVVFWKDLVILFHLKEKENRRMLFGLGIATIPAVLAGFFLKDVIEGFFASILYLGIFFMISGVIVYCTKFTKERKQKMNYFDSIFVGIFQAIAILPGISRSGSTISAGLFRGISREKAVKFAFLLSIPVIFGASFIELPSVHFAEISYGLLIFSFVLTFFVSIFVIRLLRLLVYREKFYLFGIYNFLLGLLLILLSVF